MVKQYARLLKVSSPEGKKIYAKIFRIGDNAKIEINYLDIVKTDDPPFACNGVIRLNVPTIKYKETIDRLTKYLESLFLKGMADEDIYTGLGAKPKSRRTKKLDTGRKAKGAEGQGDSPGLHISARGSESTESPGSGKAGPEMAEGSDQDDSGEDKRRD
jgi:hypothetical protein